MAHYQRGQGRRPLNDFEQQQLQICYNLGVGFPPNPGEVWPQMQFHKNQGGTSLNNGDLCTALNYYAVSLQAATLFPGLDAYREEQTKIRCNMSLVLFRMRRYKEAEDNAVEAMAIAPTFIKGYWRAFQAVIGGPRGPYKALPYLSEGLRQAMLGAGSPQDVIAFLTELCTIVPVNYNSAVTNEMIEKIVLPELSEKDIWTKTLQKLSASRKWDSLKMIILGNSGPVCKLRGICQNFDLSCLEVGAILELSVTNLKSWGISLAVKLLEQGAPVDNISAHFKRPAVHVGVEMSMRTDSVRLLYGILQCYKDNADAKNAQNADGETALHFAILSGHAFQPIVERILDVLLQYGCDTNLRDKHGKRPMDYVVTGTNSFKLLKKAEKSVDELRQDLEATKQKGNAALKSGHNREALMLYKQALETAQLSEALYKEAAILYSNTAKVMVDLNDLENALTNALAAISCDKTYHKGHWWNGKVMCLLKGYQDGFNAYIDGFNFAVVGPDVKLSFLTEAVTVLQHLNQSDRVSCYEKLKLISREVWPPALQKLTTNAEWKCVAYLILGPNLEQKQFRTTLNEDKIKKLCSGIAGNCSMNSLDLRTIFAYIQHTEYSPEDVYWLEVLLLAIYHHGNNTGLGRLAVDDKDTPLHAVTRFTLFTGRFGLLDEVIRQPLSVLNQQFVNANGDSVFHTITKMLPLPEERTLVRVTKAFMDKGFSTMMLDNIGELAVDNLDKTYSGYVFDLFFKTVTSFSMEQVNQLKEKGNDKYKSGDILDAIELYTEAITMIERLSKNKLRDIPGKDIAVLYGNRAEGYIKMGYFEAALDDAKLSVACCGHWYKGHMRVAKALKGLKRPHEALKAFVNAFSDVDQFTEEKVRIEILSEITVVCNQMPRDMLNRKAKMKSFPEGQGHLWAKTSYDLIRKEEWERASIAYNQFKLWKSRPTHFTSSLTPLCKLKKLSAYPWAVDLIYHFLNLGADRKTLTLSIGDTYMHAAVRISLVVESSCANIDWLIRKYKEVHLLDRDGNTVLHTASKEKGVGVDKRYNIIIVLLKANVDPHLKNRHGEQAIDLLSPHETKNTEILRMAMYRVSGSGPVPVSSLSTQQGGRQNTPEFDLPPKPKQILKKSCEDCRSLLEDGLNCFEEGEVSEGYGNLTEIFRINHKSKQHEEIVKQAVNHIVDKLGEKSIPEIASCLTSMPKDYYQRVIDGLIQRKKWQQLHAVVRKYRFVKGSDQLKGFASGLSIVPVIDDPALKDLEEDQIQIISNMLNSGASMGTDNGQTALKHAKGMDHYKLVADLIKRGADTSQFSLTSGDTPIHAIVTLVLEREKALTLLEFVIDQYEKDPASYPHLNPCQQNKVGDSLFHLVVKGKCTAIVLKMTEFLCNRKLSARYYNKEKKLPIHYITKKNDRRLQYIRLAAMIEPVGLQKYGPDLASESEEEGSSGDELKECPRKDEVGSSTGYFLEKVKLESERDQMKRRIEELIRILPDNKPARSAAQLDLSVNVDTADENEDHEELKSDIDIKETTKDHNENDALKNSRNLDTENGLKILDKRQTAQERSVSSETCLAVKEMNETTDKNLLQLTDNHVEKDTAGEGDTKTAIHEEQKIAEENLEQVHDHGDASHDTDIPIIGDEQAEMVKEIDGDNGMGVGEDDENGGEVVADIENDEEDVESESEDEEEDEEETEFDAEVFDNLEWEVECTAEVWKTLRDKRVTPGLKNRIMRKIRLLASGDWQPVLCKKLKNVPKTIDLFEAKFSKGSRIIWEKAIAFSPRCSETAERRLQLDTDDTTQAVRGGRIYSEIIRVWEIVFDHDKIYRSVERIKQSHHRGEECIIQKKLRGIKTDATQLSLAHGCRIYPKMFAENDVPTEKIVEQQEEMHQYFPPASSNETEYHILKFYSFSSTLVSHVLQNIDTKVDFPFRVTDLEHAIINLSSKTPILLLGRSGTGKTTCCLYRLWSQFLRYWIKATEADAPLIPRSIEFVHTQENNNGGQDEESDDTDDDQSDVEEGACCQSSMSNSNQQNPPITDRYDHIHQLFITKNLVLCSEVQKNFHELSHADNLMNEHVQHEEEVLPNKLQDIGDYSFPLFLTSRQLLMMLDASIGQPYFFDRKEDGSLKADVTGWSDDGMLSVLSLLEEDSDNEMEEGYAYDDDEQDDEDPEVLQTAARKNKVDPRREITYPVFVEEVWPKIKKKMNYHPSLIWTEIMSFIKGSFEALSQTSGYLCLEDYLKLGKKRAPNFSAEREPIHQFFKRYEHFKKQNRLFDETDLVYNIYGRLKRLENRPWVIHQVYVDETQDFTQAELCLLIRMCQNPNDMFLTGDTAQSIMRGISFRFSDLRSLFYHAKKSMQAMGKTSAVEVPKKVYQLTHNYRSHSGILSLASSVLDLMVEFFPESFDRLQRDQGLFSGPQPILLESCSFSDLAVLLRGNKRRTSHIEFGAHQAILVVNEAARDAIPEELRLGLVLTIYEAKGLEFDDVLIYNFFKDSQAVKEWRVVTDYLERLLASQREQAVQEGHQESLVEIDEGVLQQEHRPRPLDFDPNLHKVLNSELKHLYTALTRARVNVWIFDEDEDKRAPMFEYFNARRLVKSITVSEINEKSLSETVFAEKSTREEWIRRGEDFMRHSLYIVAAKCFGMAGDLEREKVALAHVQALKASRLKESPREMSREFLKAAEMYLNCYKPAKAAICLQNARERELAAELFEKLGQYEKSGDIYRKLKLSIASSRCYEQLGNFNKAIEVLYENENYDMAMDTLKRYDMRIKDYTRKNAALPGPLVAYKPADYYTAEKLSHRAAEKFYRLGNTERMLDAIDSIPKVSDRVEFLKKKGMIQQAAEKLKENGELKSAIQLLLMHGFIEEATAIAKGMHDQAMMGYCILVSCRVLIAKTKEDSEFPVEIPEFQKKELLKTIAEGINLFEVCQHYDEFGELRLLQAQISMNMDNVELAWKAFSGSKPVPNHAGMVECVNWVMNNAKLEKLDLANLRPFVSRVGHMFRVCNTLSRPNDAGNLDRVNKYLQFYGLTHYSQNELELHPKERPLCLTILKSLIGNIDVDKKSYCRVNKEDAHQAIIAFLLRRTIEWVDRIWEALYSLRNKNKVCSYFEAGLECPDMGNVDNNCPKLHRPMVNKNMSSLIDIDLLLVEFEGGIQDGATKLQKVCPAKLRGLVDSYLAEGERDLSEKYKACFMLLEDLMPFSGHPQLIDNDSGELIKFLQKKTEVLSHVRDFLKEEWKISRASKTNRVKSCLAAKETEIFILFEFGYHLFGLDVKCKIEPSPLESVQALERAIDAEGVPKLDSLKYLTLVTYPFRGSIYIECIGKRFMEAYSFISSSFANPYEAVYQFSKFVILQKSRPNVSQLPDLHHYAMWLEFYLTIAIILTAKSKTVNFPDFLVILPSNYLALLKFVEATFPNPNVSRVIQGIDRWQPPRMNKIQERLQYMSFGVCGFGQRINILDEALRRSLGNPHFYAIAERIIILQMLLVLNIGKAAPVECEWSLMKSLSHIKVPPEGPDRLQRLARYMQHNVHGIADVADALESILKSRCQGEELLICKWDPKSRQKLVTSKLESRKLFSAHFFNPGTIETMHGLTHNRHFDDSIDEEVMEDQPTEEEIHRKVMDKRKQEENERLNRSATKITKFFRRIVGKRQAKRIIAEKKRELVHGEFKQFDTMKVTEKHCGYCGLYFEAKLAESLEYEQSMVVGAHSIMNVGNTGQLTVTDDAYQAAPTYTTQEEPHSYGAWGHSIGTGGKPNHSGDNGIPFSSNMSAPTSPELGPQAIRYNQMALERNLSNEKPTDLKKVKQDHLQQPSHMRTKFEYGIFEKKCKEKILPKLNVIREFFENLDYQLEDREYSETAYERVYMEIERMQKLLPEIDTKILKLFQTRQWSNTGVIEQLMTEIGGDFDVVRPHVEDISNAEKEKDDGARQSTSATNTASRPNKPKLEIDDEDLEVVVEEPGKWKKARVIRNSRGRGRRGKRN